MNAPSLHESQRAFARLPSAGQMKEIVGKRWERTADFDRSTANEEDRTVWMSIASDRPYERWFGIEILDMSSKSIRAERLNNGAPILVDHNGADLVGVIEKWELKDSKLRVLARFSTSVRAEEVWQDVLSGIRKNTSIGYIVHKAVLAVKGKEINTYRVTDFEPLEGSLVSIPADPSVGPGRALSSQIGSTAMTNEAAARADTVDEAGNNLSEGLAASDAAARADQEKVIAKRNSDMIAVGAKWPQYGGPELALKAIGTPGMTIEKFNREMLNVLERKHGATQTGQVEADVENYNAENRGHAHFGMNPREIIAGATSLKAFKGMSEVMPGMTDLQVAYRAGMWCQAVLNQNQRAAQWCREHGVQMRPSQGGAYERTLTEGVFTSAGWLIPPEMEAAIISNREEYGAVRRIANVIPMSSVSTTIPRITTDVTAYFVGEGSSGTTSDPAGDQITLTLKDLMAYTKIGKNTANDTIVALAELVAREQARAFAIKEDACAISGDGTSTYGGIRGMVTLLETSAYSGGVAAAASGHNLISELDASDVVNAIGKLPVYARTGARWLCSGVFDASVFGRLKLTAGGNDVQSVQGRIIEGSYAGFPITLSQTMPATSTDMASHCVAILGNFQMGLAFGSGSGMTMLVDPYTLADQNLTRIITTERIDIVAHGVNKSTTVPGPIISLQATT